MENHQEDVLSMLYTLKDTNGAFSGVWNPYVPYRDTWTQIGGKIPLIESNRDVQLASALGLGADKKTLRAALIEKVYFIANRLQSYAIVTGNNTLLESINYNLSGLKRLRDTDLTGASENVQAKATANLTALATYGVSAALVTVLQTATTAYSTAQPKPRSAKIAVKAATANLKVLFGDVMELLEERLDRDIEYFRTSNPDFYAKYHAARKVIPTGKRHISLRLSVFDKITNEPISHVAMRIEDLRLSKKTTAKGNLREKHIAAGKYNAVFSKAGYKNAEMVIVVIDGEPLNLKVGMEKE